MATLDDRPPDLPRNIVARFPPERDRLLMAVSRLTDDDLLAEISQADYDQDADDHLRALRLIRDFQKVPSPMEWVPHEVLALVRWSEPTDPDWKPGGAGRRGHIMRAFACAALLRTADEPANRDYFDGENATLVQLIDSVLELGDDLPEALACFLTWRIPRLAFYDERPFFAFGLLLTLALGLRDTLAESDLNELASVVVADEGTTRRALGEHLPPSRDRWLFGLTFFDLKYDTWRLLAARLRNQFADRPHSNVLAVGRRIDGPA